MSSCGSEKLVHLSLSSVPGACAAKAAVVKILALMGG